MDDQFLHAPVPEGTSGTYWAGDWVVPESSGRFAGQKTAPVGNRMTRSRLPSLEASNYTDDAAPAAGV